MASRRFEEIDRKMYLMREAWEKLTRFMSAQLKWNSRMDARVAELEAKVDALTGMRAASVFEEFFGADRPLSKKEG